MKILIIGPSWVGDSVISQSLFKEILLKSNEAEIDVLSPEWTRSIFSRMDEVSKTIKLPFSHGEIKLKEVSSDIKKEIANIEDGSTKLAKLYAFQFPQPHH